MNDPSFFGHSCALPGMITGFTAGGYMSFGLYDVGAAQPFFYANAWAFANSSNGGSASEIVVRDLNPGTYVKNCRHHRYEGTWSGHSEMYCATVLMQVYTK